ncbi:MAG: glucose-6-phosphate isomerase [Armatimonadota bacterium]
MSVKSPITLDAKYLAPNLTAEMVAERSEQVSACARSLREARCAGAEFTGWLRPAEILTSDENTRLNAKIAQLRNETDVLVVIGIGGSYLGSRAVIEALSDCPERVVYAGQNISADYATKLITQLSGKRVAINVISKSGTTTEPAVAFRLLKQLVPADKQSEWIVATTDANKGSLLKLAREMGCATFVVPDTIGGRYSVLSAVGLLPIGYAGVDIKALVQGAAECAELCAGSDDPLKNPALFYAAARNVLCHQGYSTELLANFEPRLHTLAEWWKQLFGESEGKQHTGLFPAAVDFTTDLHSMGQYVQEGRRNLIESFVIIDGGEPDLTVPAWDVDADGMNYLAGKQISWVNQMAYEATAAAHRDGGVPNLTIHLAELTAAGLGALMYMFEYACGVSCLMQGVNPFNQPGVEAYKLNMFKLLGKPGYEGGIAAVEAVEVKF